MRMFWFYKGAIPEMEITEEVDKQGNIVWQPTGKIIEVERGFSLEEALEKFKDWETDSPQYKPLLATIPGLNDTKKYKNYV